MSENTSKKTRKFIIAAAIIVAVAAVVFVICFFIFRNREPKLVYKTLDEVIAEAPDVLDKKYENIKLPDTLSIDNVPKELYTFTTRIDVPIEETKKLMVDITNASNTFSITENDLNVDPNSGSMFYEYFNVFSEIPFDESEYTDKMYYSRSGGGETFMLICPYLVREAYGYGLREKYYKLGTDDISDVVYSVFGEQYTAQQAIDYADSVVEKYKDYLLADDDKETIKAKYLIIAKNDCQGEHKDEYSYIVRYAYYYDGVEISTDGAITYAEGTEFEYSPQMVDIVISKPDCLTLIDKYTTTYDMQCQKIDEDKFVTLESALDRASFILAPKFIQNITDVEIVYVARQDFTKNPRDKHLWETEPVISYRPMWRLKTNIDHSDQNYMPCGRDLYIDMVTGEIVLHDDSKARPALTEDMIKDEMGANDYDWQ